MENATSKQLETFVAFTGEVHVETTIALPGYPSIIIKSIFLGTKERHFSIAFQFPFCFSPNRNNSSS